MHFQQQKNSQALYLFFLTIYFYNLESFVLSVCPVFFFLFSPTCVKSGNYLGLVRESYAESEYNINLARWQTLSSKLQINKSRLSFLFPCSISLSAYYIWRDIATFSFWLASQKSLMFENIYIFLILRNALIFIMQSKCT